MFAGGPCRGDPNASRTDGSMCTDNCPVTTFCGSGTISTLAPVDKCDGVLREGDDCLGGCCNCNSVRGVCAGPKRRLLCT